MSRRESTGRESHREDLLREATALVERAEFRISSEPEPVTIGFRRDGAASFFFGSDPVYQFNTAGELRRAYIGGLLYKAERGRLISLRRQRSNKEVALLRTELLDEEAQKLLSLACDRLLRLQQALLSDSITVIGQIPPKANVMPGISGWLAQMPNPIRIAQVPNAR